MAISAVEVGWMLSALLRHRPYRHSISAVVACWLLLPLLRSVHEKPISAEPDTSP